MVPSLKQIMTGAKINLTPITDELTCEQNRVADVLFEFNL